MTFDEFKNTLSADSPPAEINELLTALWFAAKGDWESAHSIAQDIPSRDGAWIHAYLHHVEGDIGNANYWYGIAGRNLPPGTLDEEWEDIAKELISQS